MSRNWILAALLITAAAAHADDASLMREATVDALETARASLAGAPLDGVARIGVAEIAGEGVDATPVAKSILTKGAFDVVLTSDADWEPLLAEFTRQMKREDLLIADTAHELRVQGIDAVVYGVVEGASVEDLGPAAGNGRRAEVSMLLYAASLAEDNPGALLWSEPVNGVAQYIPPETPESRLIAFVTANRLYLLAGAAVMAVIALAVVYRRAITPR